MKREITRKISRATQVHLDNISVKSYKKWLESEAFICYASSTTKIGLVELGANGLGDHAVRIRHKEGRDTHFYKNATKALEAYKDFLTLNIHETIKD